MAVRFLQSIDFKSLETQGSPQCSHGSSPPGKLHAFHGKLNASWRFPSFTSFPVNNDDGKSYPTGDRPLHPVWSIRVSPTPCSRRHQRGPWQLDAGNQCPSV